MAGPTRLKCGRCGGVGTIQKEYKSTPDPTNPKRVETSYRTERCPANCNNGYIN